MYANSASAIWSCSSSGNSRACAMASSSSFVIVVSLRRFALVPEPAIELFDELDGRPGDHRARRKDRLGAGGPQCLVILQRDDAPDHDHDVAAALPLQLRLELRHEGQMSRRDRGHAE